MLLQKPNTRNMTIHKSVINKKTIKRLYVYWNDVGVAGLKLTGEERPM